MASIVLKGRHNGIKEDDRSERQQTRRDATRDTGVVEEQERLGVCECEAVWPLCVRAWCSCVAPDGWNGLQNADDEEVSIGKTRELLEEELGHTVQQCVVAVCRSSSSSSSERWVSISILL